MKKRILYIFIFITVVVICFGSYVIWRVFREKTVDENVTVFTKRTENGYQLIRNGSPFYINGASGDSRFKELSDFGGNTIQLYDTVNLQSNLDEALKNDLAVVVNIPIPKYSYEYPMTKEERINLKRKVKLLVEKHKNHEALLIWNLGNEIYPHVLKGRDFLSFNFLKVIREKTRYIKTFNGLV